jgi:hypothetical protein
MKCWNFACKCHFVRVSFEICLNNYSDLKKPYRIIGFLFHPYTELSWNPVLPSFYYRLYRLIIQNKLSIFFIEQASSLHVNLVDVV